MADTMDSPDKPIRRREFLSYTGKTALAASAASALGTSSSKAQARPSALSNNEPEFIIDAHTHCGGTKQWVEAMAEQYRAHNAMACVLTWTQDMDLMLDAMAEYPDVFIGFGRVHLDDPNAVREVEEFHKNGFVGMKFHSPRKNWDDPSYFQIYRLCEEYGMHMLFHTGITSRRNIDGTPRYGAMARMRPVYLDAICRQFPNATIQGAHFGNPWYEEAAECARWNPNLYFDITGSSLHKFIQLDKLDKMNEYLWWANWDQQTDNPHTLQGGPSAWEHILFGTDEGPDGLTSNIDRFQQMLDANNVQPKVRKKMWGLTMAKILGIDPVTKERSG